GALTAILYWLSNPIWIGGTLSATAIAALQAFVVKGSISTTTEIVIGLAFTWVTVAVAIMAFRLGKWGPNIGTIVKAAVVGIFFVLVVAFLISKGQPGGTVGGADFKPTSSGFLGVIGVIVFLWVGFELSNGESEEMNKPQNDVPFLMVGCGIRASLVYVLSPFGLHVHRHQYT